MAEFLTDPSVLTKDKLKSALLAHNVLLPNGEQRKGVYVDLYLKNLTVQNQNQGLSVESFSSDEELTAGMPAERNRSGRKATKKSDRVREEEVDVTGLTDGDLKEQLLKYNVNVGPIVASTRKLYEKKLQRLLDQGPPETVVMVSQTVQTDSGRNGDNDADQYSDKEEETEAAVLEPEPNPEPEPVPVVERPLRSRGRTPVTSKTRNTQNTIEKLSSVEHNTKTPERNILREMFPHETLSTPTGISATCRKPIKGAASRLPGDAWLDDLRPRLTETRRTSLSSYAESRSVPHISPSVPAVPLSATKTPALSSAQPKSKRRPPMWVQLMLLGAVAGFLLFVYQVMESNETSPFEQRDRSAAVDGAGQ